MEEEVEGRSKKIHGKRMRVDRVSELPDCLLFHILSSIPHRQPICLDFPQFENFLWLVSNPWEDVFRRRKSALVKDAAVTSVLSKRWQYLWAELPVLRFFETEIHRNIAHFVAMVDRAVAIRTAKHLEEFYLHFRYDRTWSSHVDVWLEFASKSKAKIILLSLVVPSPQDFSRDQKNRYTFPEMMYFNSSLVELFLGYCIVAPQTRVHWKSLVNLVFFWLEIREHVLENILSGCPVLSSLVLRYCWGFRCLKINSSTLDKFELWDMLRSSLEISAPNLRHLRLVVLPVKEGFQLTNMSSLLKALVLLGYSGILQVVRHVPELGIGDLFFKSILSAMVLEPRLPQSTRISLIVKTSLVKEMEIHGILRLLESSPKLEKLAIQSLSGDVVSPSDQPVRDVLSCDLLHLNTVIMECVINDAILMLVRILLKRATVLDKMSIHTNIKDKDELAVIVQEVLAYPRSSKKAQVLVS